MADPVIRPPLYVADPAAIRESIEVAAEELDTLLRLNTNRATHLRLTRARMHLTAALVKL